MEVVEWSARLARKRAFRVRCLLAPLSMMHILQIIFAFPYPVHFHLFAVRPDFDFWKVIQ